MVEFSLQIELRDDALDDIAAAGQFVTIVRSVRAFVRSTQADPDPLAADARRGRSVAWLALQPLETNIVKWADRFEVFAAKSIPGNSGGVISPIARTRGVAPGETATFQNGHFTVAATAGLSGYRARNQGTARLTHFGLIASATVNDEPRDAAPLSVQPVLRAQVADFTVDPGTVTILLTNVPADGSLLPAVDVDGLTVTLDETNPTARVGFNGTGFFQLMSDHF